MQTSLLGVVSVIVIVVGLPLIVGTAIAAPTVSVENATVTAGETATVGVTLSEIPNGLRKYNVTVSLRDGTVGDLKSVRSGEVGNFEVVDRSEDSITFRAVTLTGVEPGSGPVRLGTVTFNETTEGTSKIDVTIHSLVDTDGDSFTAGVDQGTLRVRKTAAITFANQTTFGESVVIEEVLLPDGGFVTVRNRRPNGSIGNSIGRSQYLSSGGHEHVGIQLDLPLSAERTVVATVINDSDENQGFDGEDNPYTGTDNDPIRDAATVSLWGGPVRLVDGERYWRGQSLVRSLGVDPNEAVRLVRQEETIRRLTAGETDSILIQTAGLQPDTYWLQTDQESTLATFELRRQSLAVTARKDAVNNRGRNTTTTISLHSNRSNYAATIDSRGLSTDQLNSVFRQTELRNGTVIVTGLDDSRLQANFTGIDSGNYTLQFEVMDTTANGNVSIDVESVSTTNVDVVLNRAPKGLQLYAVSVYGPNKSIITEVQGKLIDGIGIQNGGPGESFVRARAADFSRTIGSFEGNRTLYTVTFLGTIDQGNLTMDVHKLENDNGSAMDPGRIRLVVEQKEHSLFSRLLPGTGANHPPRDLDGDGLYEDVDGNGETTFADAIALAFADTSALSQPQIDALDMDGDGDVDFDDAIELAFQV